MMPHPPFIYAGGMHACWPDCNAFDNVAENIGISPDRWAALMESQLTEVNRRVVKAMDQLISTHPDAVIVLFSDHGGRISYDDRSEWHRSFLASRSPGHKNVFAGAPGPTSLLRVLTETYQPGSSD